ncbi:tetratricopeptide repeat protein [Alteromonas antoniana]|uniref:tetratricopeptide repeat protein n=1 Tax=Alteromonas antoniana TaxID=2803813 RepID=UPI001C44701B|nr:SEL1-like repeat protein [Alteromonas antoniana]
MRTLILFGLLLLGTAAQADTLQFGKCDSNDCQKLFGMYQKYSRTHSDAAVLLGDMYLNGYGTEENQRKALKYFKRGASWGSLHGRYKAGLMMLTSGDADDKETGLKYLLDAANRGHKHATYFAGEVLSNPEFGVVDLKRADGYLATSVEASYHAINQTLLRLREDGKLSTEVLPETMAAINKANASDETSTDAKTTVRSAPASDKAFEVVTVNGPDLQKLLLFGLQEFRDNPNDINSTSTGTRIRGRTCSEVANCKSVDLEEFQRYIWYFIK